jgi:hypothetical protein
MSTELTNRLDKPLLRFCRSCNTTHSYEQTFRLAAFQAGLELEPGTSPPVLRRIPGHRPTPYKRLGGEADERFDVIRGYLRFFGPAPVKAIAAYLEAPTKEVAAHLPEDIVEVRVAGLDPKPTRYALAEDLDALASPADHATTGVVRLVGSHDAYLQLRDRELLVPDGPRQKDLWRILGRPGAVLVDGEVAATWRPRASGRTLSIQLDAWRPIKGTTRVAVEQEAACLAAHRGLTLGAVNDASA